VDKSVSFIVGATPRRSTSSLGAILVSAQIAALADQFLADAVTRLREHSFSELAAWPDWPANLSIDLQVPSALEKFTFTLMKDTLPDGAIRVAIQRHRHGVLGIGEMAVDGFVVYPDEKVRVLSERDTWDLT
jgi:hypothetical protein